MTFSKIVMNKTLSTIYRASANTLLTQNCRRQLPVLRRYVNWTPDKPTNKKPKGAAQPSRQPGDAQSPAEPDKASPPPSASTVNPSAEPEPKPQLLRLKNDKTSEQWEQEWGDRVWRAGQLTLVVGVFFAAYAIGAGYIHLPYGMNYRASKLPKEGSEEEVQYFKRVEDTLHSLPIVQQLSEDKDWIKTIGVFPIPKEDVPHNLTTGALSGMGKITVKPVTFYNDKTKEFVVVMHVGQDVCGHRGLVHGGFLATILDECLGKTV
jgi:hypothetical protein